MPVTYDYALHPALEPGTIRIFKLLPGRRSAELKGNLLSARLSRTTAELLNNDISTSIEYKALSYTWGPTNDNPTDAVQVLLGSEEYGLPIHANLSAALRQLRDVSSATYWWIDAVCINQSDVGEKNVQLPLMPQVYGTATEVAIWLGEEYENSTEALTLLSQFIETSDFDGFLKRPEVKDGFVGVIHLMKRPWFTRRWVIQEIACARRARLHCGQIDIPWQTFVDAIYQLAAHKDQLRWALSTLLAANPGDVENFNRLSMLEFLGLVNNMLRKRVDGRISEHMMTLEALLASTPQFESSNPKDTVYALLFLARDAEATTYEDWLIRFRQRHKGAIKGPLASADMQNLWTVHRVGYNLVRYLGLEGYRNKRAIMVDYKKSMLEISRDVIKFVITHSGSIDMLCRPWAPSDMNLPSWVRTQAESAHLPALNGVYRRFNADPLVGDPSWVVKLYRASSGTTAHWSQQTRDLRSLVLQGFVLDRICAKDAVATAGIIPMSWTKMAGWDFNLSGPPERFWRTLVGDRITGNRRAPSHWGQICARAFVRRPPGQDFDTTEAIRHNCPSAIREFLERVQCVVWGRRLVMFQRTETMGLTSRAAKKGDLLCILKGCSVPVVLREFLDGRPTVKSNNPDPFGHFAEASAEPPTLDQSRLHYEFIGEAYVHGMMDGEAYTYRNEEGIPPHSFRLM